MCTIHQQNYEREKLSKIIETEVESGICSTEMAIINKRKEKIYPDAN